jgi:tetratricopeptide (TPR) repeat protein
MHVESVSWIAERKDVLYTFFYLLGLLTYLKYTVTNKKGWYWGTFLLFVAACLSKPMAVMFPLALLCTDVLLQRPMTKKLLTEKIVFFAASIFFGGLAVYTQNRTGAIASFNTLTIAERFMFASYGFVMYIARLFYPLHLSTFYPYPIRYIGGSLPAIYYAAPLIAISIIALPLYITYKKDKDLFRIMVFGLGFFSFNIVHVLQFLSVGAAIMADRYSYLPYIGLFFLIAYFAYRIIMRYPKLNTAIFAILLVFSGTLAYLCYQRTFAWHDSETLTSDAIEEYPYRALLSYKWRGHYYYDKGETDKALADYNVLVMMRSANAKIYDKIGTLYTKKGDYPKAIDAFNSAIALEKTVYKTYVDRANAYRLMGDTARATQDYLIASQLNPDIEKVTAEYGFNLVQSQQFEEAIKKYDELVKMNPSNAFYYFYRGVAEFSTDKIPEAINDWEKAMTFDTKDVLQSASYNLSVVYHQLGKDSLAAHYVLKAKDYGYKVDPKFVDSLVREYNAHRK